MTRNPTRRWVRYAVGAALTIACGAASAQATEREELERLRSALDEVVRSLAERGSLPRQDAERLLRLTAPSVRARPPAVAAPLAGPGVRSEVEAPRSAASTAAAPPVSREPVRVPFVPESTKRELREEIKAEVLAQARAERWGDPGTLPEWLDWLRFDGDLRMRAQTDRYGEGNAPASILYDDSFAGGALGTNYADVTNTSVDRNRLRIRARLGLTARPSPEWMGAMRLSTGNALGPVSTSSTSGDPTDRFGIKLDRAFIRWSPNDWASTTIGRAPNPFYSTEALFAPDLGFDGLSGTLAPRFGDAWRLIGTAGMFMLRENALAADRTMGAMQFAAEYRPSSRWGARLAYGRYRYANEEGVSDTTNFGTPSYALTEYERGFRQKGNTLYRINNALLDTSAARWGLASQFDVEQIHAALDFIVADPVTVALTSDVFRNRGFDRTEIISRTGFDITEGTRGWLHRLTVGSPAIRARNDWQFGLGWRHVEKDATLDAFTDPEFMLGGTNIKGWNAQLTYGLDRNTSIAARYLSGRQIEGPPYALDILQIDLNMRF
ncbi:MAG: putative porin [Burkholderiales bacterium]